MSLYDQLFYASYTSDLFSEKNLGRTMLQVEAALVGAQAGEGMISEESAHLIITQLKNMEVDFTRLKQNMSQTGTPVVGLLQQIKEHLDETNPELSNLIHLGATSQDIVDTTSVLLIRDYFAWLRPKLHSLKTILVALSRKHIQTLMIGRTINQQASLTTFGVKTAGWLGSICRSELRLEECRNRVNSIQLGGSVGIGNSFLQAGVKRRFADILDLEDTPAWHVYRDNLVELASGLGILTGSLGKIAVDILALAQTEVGELAEPQKEGKGASSAMPHKRNPMLSTIIRANAQRIPFLVATMMASMPQEQERSAGLWHSEWEVLHQLMGLAAGSMEKVIEVLKGLEVRVKKMRANIEMSQGFVFADHIALSLTDTMGKEQAFKLVGKACDKARVERKHLKAILEEMIQILTPEEVDALFATDQVRANANETVREILSQYGYIL